jgi:GT2 family glycosyltransferase
VQHCYPEVQLLPLERNEGPAVARNAGFEAAKHDFILFVDNDVAIAPDCAWELCTALAERPGTLAAMPRVLFADRPETIQYEGADCHFLGHMIPRHSELAVCAAPKAIAEVNSLVTACFLLNRGLWEATPPFDPSFIFNYEDHDFGVRSRVLGHSLIAVPTAVCLHGRGTPGLSFREGGRQAPLRVFCLMRNRWRIVLQCYAWRTLLLLGPMLALFETFQLLGAIRKGWLASWFRAAGWMLRHPSVTAAARRRIQQTRRTQDRAILGDGDIPFSRGLARGALERAGCDLLNRLTRAYWRLIEARL